MTLFIWRQSDLHSFRLDDNSNGLGLQVLEGVKVRFFLLIMKTKEVSKRFVIVFVLLTHSVNRCQSKKKNIIKIYC